MTDLELKLFAEGVKLELDYDDSNPDVGMGLFPEAALQKICRKVNYNPTVREVAEIIGLYQMKYGGRR